MTIKLPPVPARTDINLIIRWIEDAMKALEVLNVGVDTIRLVELHEEPKKPRSGDVALADGTDWNPGSGAGYYGYYGGAWHKLG